MTEMATGETGGPQHPQGVGPTPESKQTSVDAAQARQGSGTDDGIKSIAGLIAVIAGVIVVAIIAGAAISKNTQIAATVAGTTTGAVATIVGAYFGVKIGTDQTKQALNAADQQAKAKDKEAAKAQVYALNVPAENAAVVKAAADAAAAA
jgi:mannitol-specific phosphotransferase system IIBC component